jgi:hypothetical protein
MTAKRRRELGALSAFVAMTRGAPGVSGQTVGGASGAHPVILAFSYTSERVQNAAGRRDQHAWDFGESRFYRQWEISVRTGAAASDRKS